MRNQRSQANVHRDDSLRAIDAVSGAYHMSEENLCTARVELASTTAGVIRAVEGDETGASDVALKDLKRKTAMGALASTGARAGSFVLRTASLIVLARLLLKEDFGLVNMATAFTGFLWLLMDAGLSLATVQSASITRAQTSTLFWINLAVGGLLALVAAVTAPILSAFYGEPRLYWVTVALGTSFILNGAASQHRAMLQRSMRFAVLAIIDIVSLVASIAAGIGMAGGGGRDLGAGGGSMRPPAGRVTGGGVGAGLVSRGSPGAVGPPAGFSVCGR